METPLTQALAAIRARWGQQAIRQVGDVPVQPRPHLPTTFPALDKALVIGGLPRGCVTALSGRQTVGLQTLASQIAAGAQVAGEQVAYIDYDGRFDTALAVGCGVDVTQLVRIRTHDPVEMGVIVETLINQAGLGLIVVSATDTVATPRALATAITRWQRVLHRSRTVLLLLDRSDNERPAMYPTAVRLRLSRQRWLRHYRDSYGYRVAVTVVRNRFGRFGQQATIDLIFNPALRDETL